MLNVLMLLILLLSLLYLKTGMQTNYYTLVTEKSQMTRTTATRVVTAATAIDLSLIHISEPTRRS